MSDVVFIHISSTTAPVNRDAGSRASAQCRRRTFTSGQPDARQPTWYRPRSRHWSSRRPAGATRTTDASRAHGRIPGTCKGLTPSPPGSHPCDRAARVQKGCYTRPLRPRWRLPRHPLPGLDGPDCRPAGSGRSSTLSRPTITAKRYMMMSCMKVTREELRARGDGHEVSSRAVHVQVRCRGRGQCPGDGSPHLLSNFA